MRLTSEMVSELASRPAVAKALQSPNEPQSVLTFYFGNDIESEDVKKGLKEGTNVLQNLPFWFAGHEDYDKLCKSFIPTIREAASVAASKNGSDTSESVWNDAHTGRFNKTIIQVKVAKMLLFDQLARNCFRWEDEAFAYDAHSLKVAIDLGEMYTNTDSTSEGVSDDFLTIAYCFSIITCLTHSEDILNHELALKVYNKAMEDDNVSRETWSMQHGMILEHMAVIEKFGRYPHRNEAMSRETTVEEKEWLSSPDVPSWARSQMKMTKPKQNEKVAKDVKDTCSVCNVM
jgi:uncharacterized protein (DUF924 family)